MASSQAKIAANRQNAQLSSGPRSVPGKARSSGNAIRHGLCAKRMVIPGEDEAEFADFRNRLWVDIDPKPGLEEALAERIIGALWRLRRAGRIEVEILDRAGAPRRLEAFQKSQHALVPLSNQLGWAFEAASAKVVERLGRYEVRLERSLSRAIAELARLRDADDPLGMAVGQSAESELQVSELEAQGSFAFARVADGHPEDTGFNTPTLKDLIPK